MKNTLGKYTSLIKQLQKYCGILQFSRGEFHYSEVETCDKGIVFKKLDCSEYYSIPADSITNIEPASVDDLSIIKIYTTSEETYYCLQANTPSFHVHRKKVMDFETFSLNFQKAKLAFVRVDNMPIYEGNTFMGWSKYTGFTVKDPIFNDDVDDGYIKVLLSDGMQNCSMMLTIQGDTECYIIQKTDKNIFARIPMRETPGVSLFIILLLGENVNDVPLDEIMGYISTHYSNID